MSKMLSERETAVLRAILECGRYGADAGDLARIVREALGTIGIRDITETGLHHTAGSLCRKDLAWRDRDQGVRIYKITQIGRNVLNGDQSGQWKARP